jgi:hypothetical protein
VMVLLGALAWSAAAQECDTETEPMLFSAPVLITSIGQSAGAAQARSLAIRANIEATYTQRATIEELEGYATLIVVLGASNKGLGAANVNVDDEIAWATELLAKAEELGIPVIAMHFEGTAKRGPSSDPIITTFVPMVDYLIVKGAAPEVEWTADEAADGNQDGLFTTLAEENEIAIAYIEATLGAVDVLVDLFTSEPAEG